MRTRHSIVLAFVLLAASSAAARAQDAPPATPDTAQPGRIVGVVTDIANHPLDGTLVSLVGLHASAITDDSGRFAFANVPVGPVVIAVRRLGYRFRYATVDVSPGESVDGSVVMTRTSFTLDTVKVTAARNPWEKPARLDYTGKYDAFYERRRAGFARSFTREDIVKMNVSAAMDAVSRIPFVRVAHTQAGVSVNSGGGRCPTVDVFIDGRYARENAEMLDMMNASDLEAMELFRSSTGMPPEGIGHACALFVWTR